MAREELRLSRGRTVHVDDGRALSGPDDHEVAHRVVGVALTVNCTLRHMNEVPGRSLDHDAPPGPLSMRNAPVTT
jgi:hypothetical protein